MVNLDSLLHQLRDPHSRALSRLATLIENDDPRGREALDLLFVATGAAHIVGITGPPGSGKSTLLAALVQCIRASGRNVAVIAIDPSSSLTGGAVLGDRIRMMDHHGDAGVFVRSMASRGRQGGLAWTTAGLVHLFDAAGFPIILVETVGTGQDGTDIASLADTVVVVEAPGLGDGVQAIKSGLLEIGDVVVVNKADQPGADDALRILRSSFEMARHTLSRRIPVLGTVATTGWGVDVLMTSLDAHNTWLTRTGQRAVRRSLSARSEVLTGLRATLERRLEDDAAGSAELSETIEKVSRRELSPRRAIERVLREFNPCN